MVKTVFIDLDGVLGDFVGHLMGRFGKEPSICRGRYSLPHVLGVDPIEIDAICNDPVFWETIPLMDGARELVDICVGAKNVGILTSWHKWPCALEAKHRWVEHYFPFLARNLTFCREKRLVAGYNKVLIDDFDDNVNEWRAGNGQALLVPRPWNSKWKEEWCLDTIKNMLRH